MPRDTDPKPGPWRPLGERVKPEQAAKPAEWVPVPGSPGIEKHQATGRLRTNLPLPRGPA